MYILQSLSSPVGFDAGFSGSAALAAFFGLPRPRPLPLPLPLPRLLSLHLSNLIP